MNIPTKAQVQIVINNFKNVLPQAKHRGHLNMQEPCVKNKTHECGSIHCHAGWYAVATRFEFINARYEQNNITTTYHTGAQVMAAHLGFTDSNIFRNIRYLELWAEENPKLWGNVNGGAMFTDELAFMHETKRPEGARNLQDIIDHWEEVRDRLPV